MLYLFYSLFLEMYINQDGAGGVGILKGILQVF
jgi:hypothetical protein